MITTHTYKVARGEGLQDSELLTNCVPISMDFCSDSVCGVTPAAPNTILAAAAVAALLAALECDNDS